MKDLKFKIEGKNLGLAVILIGNNPSSLIYVDNKIKVASGLGIKTNVIYLDEKIAEFEVLNIIEDLNSNPEIHGILLQLPLPSHLMPRIFLDAIHPLKDVDGLHPINMGMLYEGDLDSALVPCTPQGCMHLLDSLSMPLQGKKALVIGTSLIVGRPMFLMLMHQNATVTLAHSKTINLNDEINKADIVISATGVPNLVQGAFVKEGSIVIDVGITRLPSGKICGDVDFESVRHKVRAVTPVPGGVGPMTIAYLMKNVFKSYQLQNKEKVL